MSITLHSCGDLKTEDTTDKTAPSSPSVSINNGDTSTTSTSVTLTLSATDNVGVTAYYASETSTTPSASATEWVPVTSTTSYSATVAFTLSSGSVGDNTKTVYVWFRDSAGNISAVASDSITLTISESDSTAPSSPSISINNGDTSTTSTAVTLSLSAADNVGVTAYYTSETSTTPSASASGWTTVTSTTSYSGSVSFFTLSSGSGTKTVYVWFRDAAGNVSAVVSDSITFTNLTITLPKTGQTTWYSTDDDGTLQKGVTWPNPRFTVDGTGNCITDNLTGLMWVKSPDSTTRTWQQSLDYANNLTLCGYSDWRLPNRKELRSLINYSQSNTATWLNTQGFSNVQADYYWSSTTVAYSTVFAWSVGMGSGVVSDGFYKANGYYVLPVRAGQ